MRQTYSEKIGPIQRIAETDVASVLDSSFQNESLQCKANLVNNAAQRAEVPRPNNTGMPDNLKSGIESLSGFLMDDVRVHYNSSKPATVQALAYTQGTDIHVAPGQEKYLPHEAWHVAQQMAGRVSPTTNINGMPVNDNAALEHEADVMGKKATQYKRRQTNPLFFSKINSHNVQKQGKRLTINYNKEGDDYVQNMKIIDSPSIFTYAHLSYNGNRTIHKKGKDLAFPNPKDPKRGNNVFQTHNEILSAIGEAATNRTNPEKNVHMTLEGRYEKIMDELGNGLKNGEPIDKHLTKLKNDSPVVSGFVNKNFKDGQGTVSIAESIDNPAKKAHNNIKKSEINSYEKGKYHRYVNKIKDSTKNFVRNLAQKVGLLFDNLKMYHS